MLNEVMAWLWAGGPVMLALTAVALLLAFLVVERFWATGTHLRALRCGAVPEDLRAGGGPEVAGLRRMGLIRACILIAPLLGLLGTVTGMIGTFESILRGGYLVQMSQGISEALLTTQYGLTVAAPGLLAERVLLRRMERVSYLTRMADAARQGGGPCVEGS